MIWAHPVALSRSNAHPARAARQRARRWPGRGALSVVLIVAFLSPPAALAEIRLGFKGLTLGEAIAPLLADARIECRPLSTPAADQVCSLRAGSRETIAGAPVHSIFWYARAGRLTRIVINLDARDFERVTQALATRYGAFATQRETVRTLDGKMHENRLLTWRATNGTLIAERFSGQINRSRLRFSAHDADAAPSPARAPHDDL